MLGELKTDEKFSWIQKVLGLSMSSFARLAYPRIYYLRDIEEDSFYGF